VPVMRQETSNSAALGAAVCAQSAALREAGTPASFEVLTQPHVKATYTLQPNPANAAAYAAFAKVYRETENAYVKTLG